MAMQVVRRAETAVSETVRSPLEPGSDVKPVVCSDRIFIFSVGYATEEVQESRGRERRPFRVKLLPDVDRGQSIPALSPIDWVQDWLPSRETLTASGTELDGLLLGVCLQASGPHFCPGGNPNAQQRRGQTLFTEAPFTIFLAVTRLREAGGPVAAALQGLVLGGGLAMALLADLRVLDCSATLSLGNLSRGMVPCMLLSSNLPMTLLGG
eukprot:TRINITY_DN61370_c0_g1_i1.p1 TRINITY_DN61370_c0_g1~~TRINITY_DN61370_c0_g1_i1.p1  ORF type:complete len:210 (-),score=25.76 TRINITY_DN61370_c0_g1_i1:765-1394(-)